MDIERVRNVIARMKLQEKLALIGGDTVTASVGRLNVPSIDLGDGLSPYHAEEPSALALGCTFSHSLCAAVAKARSMEAVRARRAFAGAIGCGLIMDPMRPDACDLFSEDALLTAELLKAYASAGVIGFVFTDALGQGRFSNRTVDKRALNELYLYPLQRAGEYAAAIQLDGGYLNGERVSSSRVVCDMLTPYIPSTAMVITQPGKGGGVEGASGCGAYQLEVSAGDKKAIARAVVNGTMFENKLNSGVERTVATVCKTHEFYKKDIAGSYAATNIVIDSTVLLKNDGTLPTAVNNMTLFGNAAAFDDGAAYRMLPVKDAAKKCGTFNVFFITDYDERGIDSAEIAAVCAAGATAKTVVVLCGGAAAELPMEKYANAILYCPYCPTVSAVLAMLTTTSPRGHLPFTWLRSKKGYPRNNEKYKERGDFRYESVYNGYRLFNNYKSDVLYPFGHGLDYTTCEVSRYEVSCDKLNVSVSFVIKNTGSFACSALCQIYLTPVGGTVYGIGKRLVAFRRVALEATENARMTFDISLNDFQVYDETNDAYSPVGGKYKVEMGLSSKDIRAGAEIKVPVGSRVNAGLSDSLAPMYYRSDSGVAFEPTAPEIERLLKVPFIKKPDVYPDTLPPAPAAVKGRLKRAEKTVQKRLLPLVRYKLHHTPL